MAKLEKDDSRNIAIDILLDALFLDPDAGIFLDQRSNWLLANRGERLNRLLRRFLHVATKPNQAAFGGNDLDTSLKLYIEDRFRSPVITHWMIMADFLSKHRTKISELISPRVSKVCEIWLKQTPVSLGDNRPTPYRKELAKLALDTVRTKQVDEDAGTMYFHEGSDPIYTAVLAAAPDLPDEICDWLLEMARRKDRDPKISDRIGKELQRRREVRAAQLAADPELQRKEKERRERIESIPRSLCFSSRELPPWPLGPQGRVNNHFRDVVLTSNNLTLLMLGNPKVASEVLLALCIEDKPMEDDYSSRVSEHHGLAFSKNSHPTAFWKSPFFSFFQISPEYALGALIKLVEFCTDRWVGFTKPKADMLRAICAICFLLCVRALFL